MGTYKKGILGAFSGTVGPIVGASYRGKDVIRSRPKKSSKPATDIQVIQRLKFAKSIRFLTPAKSIVSEYFGTPVGSKSRFNLAVSYYISAVINVVLDTVEIDYTKVVFAKGNLIAPQNLLCEALPAAELKLTWVDNSNQAGTKPTDTLMVVTVSELTDEFEFFLNAGTRSQAEAIIALPGYLAGRNLHVYAFMVSDDGKINTTSQHLGKFTVL